MKKVKMENAKFHRKKDPYYVTGGVYVRDADLIYVVSSNHNNYCRWRTVKQDGTFSKKLHNGYGPIGDR